MAHRNDNWGWRARIGMFIVGNEAVPEAEWWAMAPLGVSVHAARVTARAPWATWNADRSGVDFADDLARGCRQFATMRLEAVVIGHTSSSVLGGKGWDEVVCAAMARQLGAGVHVTTNGLDCVAALQTMGVTRPYVILPAWFNDETLAAAITYYRAHGFDPAGHMRYDPGPGWRDLPPGDLYPQGMGFAQQVEPLYAQIRDGLPAAADGVLICGTGFRCSSIIEALEQDVGLPVIAANQASLWRCLRLSGMTAPVSGYGRLLTM